MTKRILIIDGHPDPDPARYIHALADAYAAGADQSGHPVRRINVGNLVFPVLRSPLEWRTQAPPPAIAMAGKDIAWADHIVLLYPLWLGDVPALLKAFLEQVARPGIAFRLHGNETPDRLWAGKSARVIVTMGMPGLLYRLFYRSHSLKNLERNILKFTGIAPVSSTVLGLVEASAAHREEWLEQVLELGRDGL